MNTNVMLSPDFTTVNSFLSIYQPDIFSGWFEDQETGKLSLGKWVGNYDELIARLNGTCFHVSVATVKTGVNYDICRKKQAFDSSQNLVIDIDSGANRSELITWCKNMQATLVESSPRKYHVWLRLATPIGLDEWRRAQIALAYRWRGDYHKCVVNTTLRIPGLPRLSSNSDGMSEYYLPSVLVWGSNDSPILGSGDFKNWYELGEAAVNVERKNRMALYKGVMRGTEGITSTVIGKLKRGNRNNSFYAVAWRFGSDAIEEKLAWLKLEELNTGLGLDGLSDDELRNCFNSGYFSGCEHRVLTEEKYRDKLLAGVEVTTDTKMQKISGLDNGDITAKCGELGALIADTEDGMELYLKGMFTGEWFEFMQYVVGYPWWRYESGFRNIIIQRNGKYTVAKVRDSKEFMSQAFTAILRQLCIKALQDGGKFLDWVTHKKVESKGSFNPLATKELQKVANIIAPLSVGRGTDYEVQQDNVIVYNNGVLDLETGKFAEDLMAVTAWKNCLYASFDVRAFEMLKSPNALAWVQEHLPVFCKYMRDWFPEDAKTIGLILRWFGYSMTTDIRFSKFMYYFGASGSGKGSLALLLHGLLGEWNVSTFRYEHIAKNFELGKCLGKLSVMADEVGGSALQHKEGMNVVKMATGGASFLFERKGVDPVSAPWTAKIMLISNEIPDYEDDSGAVKARILPVSFSRSYRGQSTKLPYLEILRAECDLLASVSGVLWGMARNQAKPFEVGSEAQLQGAEVIGEGIDPLNDILDYFMADVEGEVLSTHVRLIWEAILGKPVEATSFRNTAIAISNRVGNQLNIKVRLGTQKRVAGKKYRIWKGVRFDKERLQELLSEMPEGPVKMELSTLID